MLRITCVGVETKVRTVKIEGELSGDHVSELSRVAASALKRGSRVVLDLSQVTFVDHAGGVLLRALRAGGVEFVNSSSYVSSLIDSSPAELERSGPGGAA